MAHQIDESKPKYLSQTRFMSGRRIIKTSVTEITDENVVDVLRKALATHDLNRSEIDYLWKYYRGDQPIRNRVKDVRPEICNKITENRANEIVSFKVGYLCGEPIQYVSRNGGEEIVKQINTLNEYMFAEDKAAQDQELVEWQMICGTAFRLVLPDEPGEEDEAPFELYTLDPRDTFVVYSNEIGNKPLMAVKYSKDDNEIFHYSIYTENHYYLVDGDILVESKPHVLEFTRRTVTEMEKKGFVAAEVENKPMSTLPALFEGAFLAHHRFEKKEVINEIFSHMTNKEELIGMASAKDRRTLKD